MNSSDLTPSDQLEGWPPPKDAQVLIGQDAAWREVETAWHSNRMPHCWLLTGAKGIGKATFAHKMASMILGRNQYPRVIKREPDDKGGKLKTVISVDEVRGLKQSFEMRSIDNQWRVCIIDTVDDMNSSAANATLKLIEEPPQFSVFILLSHQPGKILPTIQSRCRRLSLTPVKPDAIKVFLEKNSIAPAVAHTASILANGSIGQAARYAQPEYNAFTQKIHAILKSLPALHISDAVALADAAGNDTQTLTTLMELTLTLLHRFTTTIATGIQQQPRLDNECAWHETWSTTTAHMWAEATVQTKETFEHAIALNLDPQRTIVTVFTTLKEVAERIRSAQSHPMTAPDYAR